MANFLYRNGLWISVPVFVIAVAVLLFFIVSVIRLGKKNELLSLPLLETQDVEFAEAGRVALYVEGPLFTTRFRALTYELNAADGMRVQGRASWFHTKSSSFSKVRLEMQSFDIPAPGRYVLWVQGLGDSQAADSEHRIVFMRPHLAQAVGYTLGIIAAAGLLIGSLVLFSLRLTSKGTGA